MPTDLDAALADLVIANRILAHEGVVDGFGHVSIRHPNDAKRYFLPRSRSPELVTKEDIIEFFLDGQPVTATSQALYVERAIHGAVYAARPDVMAVCHNHADSLIPFSVTGVPIRPLMHIASVLGASVPVWDIAAEFGETDMLVRTVEQGGSLARTLGTCNVALLRGHGSVVATHSLPSVVLTSIYLARNAAMQLASSHLGEVKFLSPAEIELAAEAHKNPSVVQRTWEYWRARAGYPST